MEKVSCLTCTDADSVGQMNELPDEILVLILSKLTMEEAARTSVLSHRWENLWIYYTGSLHFDPVETRVNILLYKTRLNVERLRFVNWVNQVLNLHRGQTVDEFRVVFDLDVGEDIERWIKFAIEKRVGRFELDFSSAYGYRYTKTFDCYPFPYSLLYLPGDNPTTFGSLIDLRLNSVDLSDEVLAYFISICHSLEYLSIKGAPSLTCLKATTALKLKHLEIGYCLGLERVEVAKTNIESLKFTGSRETKIPFRQLPLLSEVSLGGTWSCSALGTEFFQLPISQLQKLQLRLDFLVYAGLVRFPERFETFMNLKHLEVSLALSHGQSIFCLTSLIYASPLLSRFTLKVDYQHPFFDSKVDYKQHPFFDIKNCDALPKCLWRKAEKHVHQCLKVVEFIGWYGQENDLEFVGYLIENAPLLEKVIIDPQIPFFEERISLCKRDEGREKTSRNCAKLLREKVRPETELVIL